MRSSPRRRRRSRRHEKSSRHSSGLRRRRGGRFTWTVRWWRGCMRTWQNVPSRLPTRSRQWRIDRAPLRVIAALAAGMLAAPAPAAEAPPPAISVTGEASVSVPPDLAQIDAGVSTEAKTAREASEANKAAMGKVLLAFKGAGIEENDFQTSRLSLQPQYAHPSKAS